MVEPFVARYKGRPGQISVGRIILPKSALNTRIESICHKNHHHAGPLFFRIHNQISGRTTHSAAQSFTAEEGNIVMPQWMLNNLNVQGNEELLVQRACLPFATGCKLESYDTKDISIEKQKILLADIFDRLCCLTVGDRIQITGDNETFDVVVMSLSPEDAVNIISSDIQSFTANLKEDTFTIFDKDSVRKESLIKTYKSSEMLTNNQPNASNHKIDHGSNSMMSIKDNIKGQRRCNISFNQPLHKTSHLSTLTGPETDYEIPPEINTYISLMSYDNKVKGQRRCNISIDQPQKLQSTHSTTSFPILGKFFLNFQKKKRHVQIIEEPIVMDDPIHEYSPDKDTLTIKSSLVKKPLATKKSTPKHESSLKYKTSPNKEPVTTHRSSLSKESVPTYKSSLKQPSKDAATSHNRSSKVSPSTSKESVTKHGSSLKPVSSTTKASLPKRGTSQTPNQSPQVVREYKKKSLDFEYIGRIEDIKLPENTPEESLPSNNPNNSNQKFKVGQENFRTLKRVA